MHHWKIRLHCPATILLLLSLQLEESLAEQRRGAAARRNAIKPGTIQHHPLWASIPDLNMADQQEEVHNSLKLQAFGKGTGGGKEIHNSLKSHGLGVGQEDQMEAALFGHVGGQKAERAERDQFVVAIPTHYTKEGRIAATRASRLGLRSFIVTNYTAGLHSEGPARYPASTEEIWAYYPDDRPARSYSKGDTRVAITPFLAYKTMLSRGQANFKWLFLGDDDSLFLVDAAREITRNLDPDMPIFLTDNAWFTSSKGAFHPHQEALRCVPCNYAKNMSKLIMNMTRGCPCTPDVMCKLEKGYNGIVSAKACGPPRAPSIMYSMHGGSGALFSIGLLRKVSYDQMEDCILSQWGSAADSYLTVCLWQMGIAMTDPDPLYHPERLTMFDPMASPYNPDEHILSKSAHFLGNLLRQAAAVCTGICTLELDHTVSLHLRASRIGGRYKDWQQEERAAQAFLRVLSRFYAVQRGLVKRSDDLSWLQDTHHLNESNMATKMDDRIAAGKAMIEELSSLFQATSSGLMDSSPGSMALLSKKNVDRPTLSVSVLEKAQRGAATAIAKQALEVILQDAQSL